MEGQNDNEIFNMDNEFEEQVEEVNAEGGLANVLAQLGTIIQHMNNRNQLKKTKLMKIPIFHEGS